LSLDKKFRLDINGEIKIENGRRSDGRTRERLPEPATLPPSNWPNFGAHQKKPAERGDAPRYRKNYRQGWEPYFRSCIWFSTRGYSAGITGAELSRDAIRLGRLLVDLLPEPEVMGLIGLMLLQESRRPQLS
jgi:hypothetical protein